MIKVTVQYGSEKPLEYLFEQERLFFGTAEECDVRLREGCGNKLHAQLREQGNRWLLKALDAGSGLRVEGNRVAEITFQNRQAFQIGDASIELEIEAASPKQPSPSSKGFMLVPAEPGMPFKAIPLQKQRTLIGRAEEADLRINERSVSRHHAVVTREELDLGWFVEDLGSHNGTFVNGVRVEREEIKPGDEIRFGRIRVHLEERGEKAPRKTMILKKAPPPEPEPAPATRLFSGPPAAEAASQSKPPMPPPLPTRISPTRPKLDTPKAQAQDKTVFFVLMVAAFVFFLALIGLLFLVKSKTSTGGIGPVPAQTPTPLPTRPALRSSNHSTAPKWRVRTMPVFVRRNDGAGATTLAGRVRQHDTWDVQSQTQGRVERIPAKQGSLVSRGDLLVQMDMSELERAMESKKATLNRAAMEIANERLQAAKEARLRGKATDADVEAAQREYDDAVERYRRQSSEIAMLEDSLSNDRILAEESAKVVQIRVRPGQFVQEGQALLTLRTVGEAIVDADVSDAVGQGCSEGMPVSAVDSRGNGYQGEVLKLLWRGHQMFLKISLNDPNGILAAGDRVDVTVETDAEAASLWVPRQAVFQEQGGPVVFAVEGGTAYLCPVSLGGESEGYVEVLEGLSPESQVAIHFPQGLMDGDAVDAVSMQAGRR